MRYCERRAEGDDGEEGERREKKPGGMIRERGKMVKRKGEIKGKL